MVYTVTCNPALDYTIRLDELEIGKIHKTKSENFYAGGKGVNVSNVLTQLEIPNVALGFVAGFTGREIEDRVKELGIQTDFVHVKNGNSRINVKIRTNQSEDNETDLNARGCDIDPDAFEEFYAKIDCVKSGDYLVLAGSIPESLPSDLYERILTRIADKKVHCFVDATGDLLRKTLRYKPFVIKPNEEELGELFETKMESPEDIVKHGRLLQEEGARNVLVSMGSKGAILVAETGEVVQAPLAKIKAINSVGAGDSMIAGFLAGWLKYGNYKKALTLGSSAGAATAGRENIATGGEILELFRILNR